MAQVRTQQGFVGVRPPSAPPPAPQGETPSPALAAAVSPSSAARAGFYLPVAWKFTLAMAASTLWMAFSVFAALPWVGQLSALIGPLPAWLVIAGIAILPGFMNAFLVTSLLLDRRPAISTRSESMPGITILVAAYNEEKHIAATVESIGLQHYPGPVQVIVINDGSTDGTRAQLDALDHAWLQVLHLERNGGKSKALNAGLALAKHRITLTVDGDSYLYRNALRNLVGRYLSDPAGTKAVAGAVLVRNSRNRLVTAIQEWDYFHGIAAIKRLQSMYQGTLVAQGAFSLYETATLRVAGGWADTVGEDIVLTWKLLEQGHRVGFAENAVLFTNAPDTWSQFIRQRQRWSRGLIEAFKSHWRLLFKPKMTTVFIWWNLLFPFMDLVYTVAFLPGLVLALFGIYWIAGPMTLLVLPMGMAVNYIMFRIQSRMFVEQGLKVRRNIGGFLCYALFYGLILQPACVLGYLQEMLNRSKSWGTK
jgi:biofilm PGA synthesis N-glycosyltransferase PgaC